MLLCNKRYQSSYTNHCTYSTHHIGNITVVAAIFIPVYWWRGRRTRTSVRTVNHYRTTRTLDNQNLATPIAPTVTSTHLGHLHFLSATPVTVFHSGLLSAASVVSRHHRCRNKHQAYQHCNNHLFHNYKF